VLCAILAQDGGYGFLRFSVRCPCAGRSDSSLAPAGLLWMSAIAICLYLARGTVQQDMKKLIAYSSAVAPRFVTYGTYQTSRAAGLA